jgi:nitroreductase
MITLENKRTPLYDINPLILERNSFRAYDSKAIPDDVLCSLFEAARWSPSSRNEQPWNFIVARTQQDKEKFYPFISPFNLEWCKQAPVLALLFANTLSSDGRTNPAYDFDVGTAWGYLSLEATRKGLVTCPMGGFDKNLAQEILHIPDGYVPSLVISIGYHGNIDLLPDRLKAKETKPTQRKELNEFLYEGDFKKHLNI